MKKRNIPFNISDMTEAEAKAVADVLVSGWITTGPKTKEFEKKIAGYCNTNKAVCLSSATASEEMNLRVCGIGEGDEVIVPAYTYTSSASAVCHTGAKVIFADSKKDSIEMDYDKLEELITEKTKAIVAVDIAGIVCDYDRIFEIAEKKKALFVPKQGNDLGARIQQSLGRIIVLSDCAHGLGAVRNGKKAGSIADFTDFSFHAVKNLTTGEGGASTWNTIDGIDDEEIYHQFQLYSLHGQSKDAFTKSKAGSWEYDIIGPWYKCNMTDITAAIGLVQFDRYNEMMDKRHRFIKKYDEMCEILGLGHLCHETENAKSSGHLYLVRVPGIDVSERGEIINEMAERGIACNVHYKPLPMMTAYKNFGWDIKNFPNAYDYYHNLITLPLYTKLNEDDIDYIIENFTDCVKKYIK